MKLFSISRMTMTLGRLAACLPVLALCLFQAGAASAETLTESANVALARHPALRADVLTLEGADETVRVSRSELFPIFAAVGEVNLDQYHRVSGPVYLQGREVGLRLNQLLYDGMGVFARLDAARAERDALVADRNRNGNTIAFGVARDYLLVVRDRALVASAQRNVDEHRRSVTRLARMVKYDHGKDFDLQQVRTREVFAESQLAERLALLERDQAAYLELVGQRPGELVTPPTLGGEGFASESAALAVALAAHPMVKAAERRAAAAHASLAGSRSTLAPRFYALARFDTGWDRQGLPGFNNEGYVGVTAAFAFGTGSLPTVRVAEGKESVAAAKVEVAKRDVREGVRTAWAQREGVIADLVPAEQAYRQSQTVLDGFKTQYTFGRRTVLELLIVQDNAFRAEAKAISLRLDRLMADYALAAQMGILENRLAPIAKPAAPQTASNAR